MTYLNSVRFLAAAALLFLNSVAPLQAESVSTGDLGYNAIESAGAYTWSPSITAPSTTLPATLEVVYGGWDDPVVTIHAFVNGTEVGSFPSDVGYIFPGPSSNSLNITGLLVDGVNTITFSGLGQNSGSYIIGGIAVNYNLPAPPSDPPPTTEPVPPLPSLPGLLHYLMRTPLAARPDSQATGTVRLQLNEQGKSFMQKLELHASGLTPTTDYILVIATDEETNAVQTVTSDEQGRLRLSCPAKGKNKNVGKQTFPSGFVSLTDIRALSLKQGLDTVASAVISTSPEFEYLIKRPLTQADPNTAPTGAFTLKANAFETNFRLRAKGLIPGQNYQLALNGVVMHNVSADGLGEVLIESWPANAPAILELRGLSLLDGSNTVVLGTTLPK